MASPLLRKLSTYKPPIITTLCLKRVIMTKVEKYGLILGCAALLISVLAWQFPVSDEPRNIPTKKISFEEKIPNINPPVLIRPIRDLESKESSVEAIPIAEKSVTYLEFSEFLYQIKTFSLDSGKLTYVRNSKHLLSRKIKFSELNILIGELSMDSNRISLVSFMQGHFESPIENDLMNYTNSFTLDSSRQKALSLIY
jgi:hypothetical protein